MSAAAMAEASRASSLSASCSVSSATGFWDGSVIGILRKRPNVFVAKRIPPPRLPLIGGGIRSAGFARSGRKRDLPLPLLQGEAGWGSLPHLAQQLARGGAGLVGDLGAGQHAGHLLLPGVNIER